MSKPIYPIDHEPDTIIFDCEILRAIPKRGESRIPGIMYVDEFAKLQSQHGELPPNYDPWRDFPSMGISCIGAYSYTTERYHVFCDDNLGELEEMLQSSSRVISFNGVKFDHPLLIANAIDYDHDKDFDLLREIWKSEGHDPDHFDFRTHANYGLEACCKANFGTEKTGNGALAPIDWQQGRYGTVIDYCLNDIALTKQLYEKILFDGFIINPKNPQTTIRIDSITTGLTDTIPAIA